MNSSGPPFARARYDREHSAYQRAEGTTAAHAAIGYRANLANKQADILRRNLQPGLPVYSILAQPPLSDSNTAMCDSVFLQREASLRVGSAAKDNFRKDDDVRWQPNGASSTAQGSPQGERGGVHQFGVPRKGKANFARAQHFNRHLELDGNINRRQTLN